MLMCACTYGGQFGSQHFQQVFLHDPDGLRLLLGDVQLLFEAHNHVKELENGVDAPEVLLILVGDDPEIFLAGAVPQLWRGHHVQYGGGLRLHEAGEPQAGLQAEEGQLFPQLVAAEAGGNQLQAVDHVQGVVGGLVKEGGSGPTFLPGHHFRAEFT